MCVRELQSATPNVKPRWFECRLRTLLYLGVAVVLVLGALWLIGAYRHWGAKHLKSLGVRCSFKGGDYWISVPGDRDVPSLLREAIGDLRHLSRIHHVTLNLSGTNVSDADLEQLASIGGLDELYLCASQVTERGIRRLERALPNCKISWDRPTPHARTDPASMPDTPSDSLPSADVSQ